MSLFRRAYHITQAKMYTYLPLFILLLAFVSFKSSANQPFKTLVAPIKKDSSTSLYTLTLNTNEHYLIDINSPFLWFICQSPHFSVPCTSPPCIQGRTYLSPLCPSSKNTITNSHCTCMVTPVNPVTKSCALSQLTVKDITLSWTNGRNPTSNITFNRLYVSCAPLSLLKSLPKNVIGVAGLSWAPLALTTQFTSSSLGVTKKFAICLPNTPTATGVMFFGDGPYNLMPPTQFDVASVLSYTSLIKKSNSPEFYVVVNGIAINGKASNFCPGAFGQGVKLSTSIPYTTLRSDIYKVFVKDFSLAMGNIPRVTKVNPFELCYNASLIGFSRVGFHVPQIDLELGNGKNWTMFGANSMKQIGNDFACLAFVDGGKTAKEAVVIGSYQMEDNFLLFDLAASRLGFSSSLLFYRTTCGSFNFTLAT